MRPLRVEPSTLVGDLSCQGDLGTFVVALFANVVSKMIRLSLVNR